jgi:hypothetical protein
MSLSAPLHNSPWRVTKVVSMKLLHTHLQYFLGFLLLYGCSNEFSPSASWPLPLEVKGNSMEHQRVDQSQFLALTAMIDESEAKWIHEKSKINSNYEYKVRWSHPLVDEYRETKIVISNGETIGRQYKTGIFPSEMKDAWQEDKKTLGSHKDGAKALTIDELYYQCRNEVLSRKPQCNVFTIELFPNGVLKNCYYDRCGWTDSNGTGVKIEEALFGNLLFKEGSQMLTFRGCPNYYAPRPDICSQEDS